MAPISHTDLILNPDGSIYHLHLLPEDIADTIILVGDPGRVKQVSSYFDSVELEKVNREFVTHTGTYQGNRISVISTGIGTDNIDIVLNELDALVNVDLANRQVNPYHKRLNLIRLGTSGALHADIPAGARIVTQIAGGFDGLYHFYQDDKQVTVPGLADAFMNFTGWKKSLAEPYFIKGSEKLITLLSESDQVSGITISTPGFYAPQVRSIRLSPFDKALVQKVGSFSFNEMRINNFEMESSALYALSALLGHEALTICIAIANRISEAFLEDYKTAVEGLITTVLDKLALHD
ncbi:MAG: nucleoside phosphorylase [Bacteroidota bacterium]